MRTSNTRARNISSTIGKIVMALVCASMIGGTFIAPAYADDHGRREGYRQHRRYKQSRRVYQPPRRHYYYYYSEPVYAPPPVYYHPAPYQSPGISIVFPLY
ncbi:MAG: hypothetical protein NUW14_08965 [Deltaproteobacteria bacterium]|uniref:hypothetical protein n=1 Tax=Candidatus Deferrimicrobium sp. TaxID=3060586 RepID=UPI00271998F8|nr:hypothetical protein [Candidatus Deferrimicrobium sp.]MCR4310123.1 hypothetical protein [Deltaproteobacteria bacterium]MDO8737875.1 hypothetical protein [Candidatus Deferrimicrobium sp.]